MTAKAGNCYLRARGYANPDAVTSIGGASVFHDNAGNFYRLDQDYSELNYAAD
jgi:hypothetical protein